jgi:hypothetical protein
VKKGAEAHAENDTKQIGACESAFPSLGFCCLFAFFSPGLLRSDRVPISNLFLITVLSALIP